MDGTKKYLLAEQLTPSDPPPLRTEQHTCHWRLRLTKAVCHLRVCRETASSSTLPNFWATGREPLWGSRKGAKGTGNLTNGKFTLSTKVLLVKAMVFSVVMYGCESWTFWVGLRKLRAEELMLLNCGVGEDSWESLGLQGHPTNPS